MSYFGFENEEMVGKRICDISYRKLVELGAVVPYEVVLLAVKREDIKNFINTNTWVRDAAHFDNQELQSRFIASVIMADKAFQKGYISKLLTFHSRNTHALSFENAMVNLKDSKLFPSFNSLDFIGRCIGGQTLTNKAILDFLTDAKKGVISNARVLTEGVSVACLNSIMFCDPKTSATDVVQAVSRPIRLFPGKEKAYVLLPVIVDDNGNIEQDSYQRLIDILDYLAGFDETLESEINIVTDSQNRVRLVGSRVINTDELEVDGIDITEFYEELSLEFWKRVKSRHGYWTEERLVTYVQDKISRNQLTEIDAALRALEANNYELWDKLCPWIAKPEAGLQLEDIIAVSKDWKGTYEAWRREYPKHALRLASVAELKSNDFSCAQDIIDMYFSHMPRETVQWKTITSQEIIDLYLKKCTYKKDTKKLGFSNLGQNLKRYPHLAEALEYYNNLEGAKTGLKVGTRRGGGWSFKKGA